ncbi:V-set domain-containing T-cell activation inhibitor 1-like [Simochromis diagramma]|uniref:V-set domain-containing T-cell activation inhibitor 1-like n=1 Tax=Simochromis diagramma TaxID=43689 RepID=UPI001A7EA5EE|nr:V-set domain-containing T-cell activation inhibitor 1-like [Simochromis diagramma]
MSTQVFRTAEMSDATSSFWLRLILLAIFIPSSSGDRINVTAVFGKNTTLPCQALNGKTIIGLEWSRPDLGKKYVLLYRDNQPDPTKQHQSFKNRVVLQDNQMTDGNVSLILKNVTTADAGIYQVRISRKRWKRAYLDSDPICTFSLSVVDPPGE